MGASWVAWVTFSPLYPGPRLSASRITASWARMLGEHSRQRGVGSPRSIPARTPWRYAPRSQTSLSEVVATLSPSPANTQQGELRPFACTTR
jgi:hypothetical protein